ncbi:MAG: hypothetical protein K1X64_20000 [Myxococcaceae bacterium]|nr:hypothetical protein [Myxococcaceae bacterium]
MTRFLPTLPTFAALICLGPACVGNISDARPIDPKVSPVVGLREGNRSETAVTDSPVISNDALPKRDGGALVSRPHEPAGYRRISEVDFSTMLPNSVSEQNCTGPAVLAGCWGHYPYDLNYHRIVDDPTAPASPPGVFQFTYGAGMGCGVSPGGFFGWETGLELRALYETGWFKIPGTDFENLPMQMKLLGYWGVGTGLGSNPATIYHVMSSATPLASAFDSDIRFQGHISAAIGPNRDTTKKIEVGRWHQYEMVMAINTIGQADGMLQFWLDGVQTHDYADITYVDVEHPSGFFGRSWAPVYGGNCAVGAMKSRDDYLWVDHLYISGIPK